MEEHGHARHDEPPHGERAETDDEGVLQADDVAQAQHGSAGVHLEHELSLVGSHGAPFHDARCKALVPPVDGSHDEVVQTADEAGDEQWLSLRAALGSADEHLRGGCGFGEGILAVHVLHEVFAERNHEQDAEDAAEQRRHEHLDERDAHLRILCLQDVDGGQREDGSGYDGARAGTDALDDYVLAQRVLALGECRCAYGDDGDRDGCLEHLAHLQSEIGCCG